MLTHHLIAHVPLQAGHKGHPPLLQLMEPPEIKIRAVGHHHAAGRERPRAGHRDVAGLAVGHADERWQMSRQVHADVQLDRAFRAPERRPREGRQAQVDGRRVHREQLVLEPEAMPRSPLLAAGQQASEERFVERVRLLCVHPRQRGTTDERSHTQVIELVGLGAQVADDVAQALQAAQLSQAEGDELRPAAHHAESLALLVLSSLGVEFMSGKQVEKLPEDCGIVGHGLDLLSFERFGAKSFYQTRRFQAALI